jgi:toxin ParE1/3/4
MLRIVVSPRAREDMKGVATYTFNMWGEAQMSRYIDGLHARFAELARFPGLGRPRDEIARGHRSIVQGSHIVFYRTTTRELVIVRILHGHMDPDRHLR